MHSNINLQYKQLNREQIFQDTVHENKKYNTELFQLIALTESK
jgi:hypothetical protein